MDYVKTVFCIAQGNLLLASPVRSHGITRSFLEKKVYQVFEPNIYLGCRSLSNVRDIGRLIIGELRVRMPDHTVSKR
jgi:hypothetical protein